MRFSSVAALALASAVAVFGCAHPGVTQLIVVADTDLAIPGDVDRIAIDVSGPSGMHASEMQTLRGTETLPFTLTVVPSSGVLGPVTIVASAAHAGTDVVSRRATVTLVQGETRVVLMHLVRTCIGTTCPMGQTCTERGCASTESPLYPWSGTPPRLGSDAGPAWDGGRDTGIVGHDANVDAASLDFDAGPDCTTLGCDDHNECTEDVCNASRTCEHRPLDVACDDRIFCNGNDHCVAGACTMHVGDPCQGATTCDEAQHVCRGCTSDAECPMPMMSGFGACGGFADTCSNAGTRTQTVRTYRCESTVCTGTDTTQSEACTRDTTGTSCAMTSCSSFGVCTGSDTCGTNGTASRTCTDYVCGGGSCQPMMRPDTVACTRATDGISCGADSCTGWSGCGGFAEPCGTSGSESRTCTPAVCSGGACGAGGSRTETQGCSRSSTDGVGCGSTTCDGWSGCDFGGDPCRLDGTQSRTCHDPVCSGGGCSDRPRTETQGCSRSSTDGASCGSADCQTPTCTGGLYEYDCDQDGFLEQSCRDRICQGGACAFGSPYVQNAGPCSISTDGQPCYAGSFCDYCWSGSCQWGGCW